MKIENFSEEPSYLAAKAAALLLVKVKAGIKSDHHY
jgi:hypothetical protein